MGVDAKHPLFGEFVTDWLQMRDTYRGQRAVKDGGGKYLPPTAGMIADGVQSADQKGTKAYNAYRMRAVFPDIVRAAVEAMLGVMHHRPPVIELPAALEPLREKATLKNESLAMLLRRINEEQLITGRLGMLLEVPPGQGATLPFVAMYRAEDIINWDEGSRTGIELESLNFVSLNESEFERKPGDFEWEFVNKYRVLILGDPDVNEPQGEGVYRVGVFSENGSSDENASTGTNFDENSLVTPMVAGKTMPRVPFVFVNAKDIVASPEEPPLLGLSNLALTIYRGEADYRQALFMQGQDTLVVIGQSTENAPSHRIGAGASIDLPMNGDAKFIGADSTGLSEMRSAIENDHTRAGKKAGEMIDETSRSRESGEALKVRVAARTATLNSIAVAGAFALQELLRMAAEWVGANPDEVVVTANTDFVDDRMAGQELAQLVGAKTMGAPISLQTIHDLMQDRNMTERTWDEEMTAILEEASIDALQVAGSTDPNGPEDDIDPEDNPDANEDDREDDPEDEDDGEQS